MFYQTRVLGPWDHQDGLYIRHFWRILIEIRDLQMLVISEEVVLNHFH